MQSPRQGSQDEIQAAIDRAEGERREIGATLTVTESAEALTIVPQAAEAYRRRIAAGLDNDPAAAAKARTILRYPLTISDFVSRFLMTCEALSTTKEIYAFTVFERA